MSTQTAEFFYRYCGLMQEEMTRLQEGLGIKAMTDLEQRIEKAGACDAPEDRAIALSQEVLSHFIGADNVDMHDHTNRSPLHLKILI